MLTRRGIVAGAAVAAVFAGGIANSRRAAAFAFWPRISPADAGFAPDLEARLDKLITSGRAWKQHGVVIARKGALVLERYDPGEDENWGRPIGRVNFGPETLHDLRSVTKSILGLLYGIALARGKVPAPDQPLLASFPDYADVSTDPRHKLLTIGNALTMTLGLDWNEDIPYQDPANSEIQMEKAQDRYRYIFSRPFIADPGTRWIYGAASTALIGKLIQDGTRQSLPDFAREALFAPIGAGPIEWSNGFNGEPSPNSGLRMTPRDLARIGQLILDRGRWDGREVVPAQWLERTFEPHVVCDEFRRYGYFWYVGGPQYGSAPNRATWRWVGAFGYGGQRLFVLPELDLVVAITAGNYADKDQGIPSIRVIREVVLASLA